MFDKEGLQHSVEHCGQNRAVRHSMNHVADVVETLQFQELALLASAQVNWRDTHRLRIASKHSEADFVSATVHKQSVH